MTPEKPKTELGEGRQSEVDPRTRREKILKKIAQIEANGGLRLSYTGGVQDRRRTAQDAIQKLHDKADADVVAHNGQDTDISLEAFARIVLMLRELDVTEATFSLTNGRGRRVIQEDGT